jgi:hypothetical protein
MEKRKRRTKQEMELARSNIPSEASKFDPQDVQIKNEGGSDHLVIKGYVNICRSPKTRHAKEWYYTGGDIHETQDKAKKVASHTTVNQVYIECDIKDRPYENN